MEELVKSLKTIPWILRGRGEPTDSVLEMFSSISRSTVPLFMVLSCIGTSLSNVIPDREKEELQTRQSNPHPGAAFSWAFVGCFTDIDTSRTLDQTFLMGQKNLTHEACFDFCASGGFSYAGVEFGQECYCDHALQNPGTLVDPSQCNTPCTGNASEACGAGGRINVFNNGQPDPSIVPSINSWVYQGCFTDNATQRTLVNPMVINAGVTVESCTLACRTTGDFTFAGLEFSQECFCSNNVATTGTLVSDSDCHRACTANTTEFCGGLNRLTTYKWSPTSLPSNPQSCISFNSGAFAVSAVFSDPPANGGPSSLPLSLIADGFPVLSFSILSGCTSCFSFWNAFTMKNGALLPQAGCGGTVGPAITTSPVSENSGETPVFTSLPDPAFAPSTSYCVMDNFLTPGGAPVLAANGRSDLWSLCANQTAGGRLDLVFSPTEGHPNYELNGCQAVSLQLMA